MILYNYYNTDKYTTIDFNRSSIMYFVPKAYIDWSFTMNVCISMFPCIRRIASSEAIYTFIWNGNNWLHELYDIFIGG